MLAASPLKSKALTDFDGSGHFVTWVKRQEIDRPTFEASAPNLLKLQNATSKHRSPNLGQEISHWLRLICVIVLIRDTASLSFKNKTAMAMRIRCFQKDAGMDAVWLPGEIGHKTWMLFGLKAQSCRSCFLKLTSFQGNAAMSLACIRVRLQNLG